MRPLRGHATRSVATRRHRWRCQLLTRFARMFFLPLGSSFRSACLTTGSCYDSIGVRRLSRLRWCCLHRPARRRMGRKLNHGIMASIDGRIPLHHLTASKIAIYVLVFWISISELAPLGLPTKRIDFSISKLFFYGKYSALVYVTCRIYIFRIPLPKFHSKRTACSRGRG